MEPVDVLLLGGLTAAIMFLLVLGYLLVTRPSGGRVAMLARAGQESFDYRRGDASVVTERRQEGLLDSGSDDDFGTLSFGGGFGPEDD